MNERELDLDRCRAILRTIATLLSEPSDQHCANLVADALAGSDSKLLEVLTSNDLWGGAGSIADQSCGAGYGRTDARRKLESLLIQLGNLQVETDATNVRTVMWRDGFAKWQCGGIRFAFIHVY